LSILIYHQVLETPDNMRPGEPTQQQFDWQMALINNYFNPISLSEALRLLSQSALPANSVCVTFDDGYLNNLEVAQPILAKHNVPATVYVASAFSEGENMWNDQIMDLVAHYTGDSLNLSSVDMGIVSLSNLEEKRQTAHKIIISLKCLPINERLNKVQKLKSDNPCTLPKKKMMTPAQVKELADLGVEIGAHSHNHPILSKLTDAQLESEISQNTKCLQQWLDKPIVHFAYPNGRPSIDFDDRAIAQLKKQGFESAVTTEMGFSTPKTDPLLLKRFTPWDNNPIKFHLRMLLNILNFYKAN